MKKQITEVTYIESPLFEVLTEDGPQHRFNYQVIGVIDGETYTLTGVTFDYWKAAEEMVAKVNKAGEVDPALWHEGTCWDQYKTAWTPEEEKAHAYFYEYA